MSSDGFFLLWFTYFHNTSCFLQTEFQKGRAKLCGAKRNQQPCLPHWRQQDQDVKGEKITTNLFSVYDGVRNLPLSWYNFLLAFKKIFHKYLCAFFMSKFPKNNADQAETVIQLKYSLFPIASFNCTELFYCYALPVADFLFPTLPLTSVLFSQIIKFFQ